tara:strand:- start:12737 stop:14098 length:1362 start_codon:yes stop_codon:yes gene_type:complete
MNIKEAFKTKIEKESPNVNIFPISTSFDKEGRLVVGGCLLSDLASRYETPLYVLDEDTLRASCRAYKTSLDKYYPGESLPIYASKANSSLFMTKFVTSEGFGIDVVSEGELLTALKGGAIGKRIVFHGNNKSLKELELAIENDVTIIIDNQLDIERLINISSYRKSQINLMVRFTPGIECHTHEYIKTGSIDSKFGFNLIDLEKLFIDLKSYPLLNLIGLHAHIGSQIFETEPHNDLVKIMIDVFSLGRELGHDLKDLNVGGGLGVKYTNEDTPPTIQSWIKVISNSIVETCKNKNMNLPRLMCEPGRSIVATSGITLYQLGSQKDILGLKRYLSVDGGMSDNPRPITYQSSYSACLADQPLEESINEYTIAGKHCESGDILLKKIELPEFKRDEILVVFGTGAYNYSMSSNYNRIPKPAAVLVKNKLSELIQRRERPEELLKFDLIPDRFLA